MSKQSSEKRRLFRNVLNSVISILLCIALFAGTTIAYFTDSVTNTGNRIVAGELKVDLLMDKGEGYVSIADGTGDIFRENGNGGYWEPGKTEIVYLQVENKGSLDLKYNILLDVTGDTELAEVLEYAIMDGTKSGDVLPQRWELIKGISGVQTGMVPAGKTTAASHGKLLAGDSDYFALAVHMNADAGDAYQKKAVSFDVKVAAGQLASEFDSFGNDYDANAGYAPGETGDSDDPTVVYYSDFGAAGDGVTDDFPAIKAAHEYANANNLKVRGDAGAAYYIGYREYESALIKTDVDWTGCTFIIDDTQIPLRNETNETNPNKYGQVTDCWRDSQAKFIPDEYGNKIFTWTTEAFRVVNDEPGIDLLGKVADFEKGAAKLEISGADLQDGRYYVYVQNDNIMQYKRNGASNSSAARRDCFIIDQDGNIDASTPVVWDFVKSGEPGAEIAGMTKIVAYRIPEKSVTIQGGTFYTVENECTKGNYNYYSTGIEINRSNVIVKDIKHFMQGQDGVQKSPSGGFVTAKYCADVTIQDSIFTAQPNFGNVGSYDLSADSVANYTLKNVVQSNDIHTEAKGSGFWGIFCSRYCKNITFDGCTVNRFDTHEGVTNLTLKNSTFGVQGINVHGFGELYIENCHVYAKHFINWRSDFGGSWEGDMEIKNCEWTPSPLKDISSIIGNGGYNGDLDYGMVCTYPKTVTVDGLTVHDTVGAAPASYNGVVVFNNYFVTGLLPDENYREVGLTDVTDPAQMTHPLAAMTETVKIKNFSADSGKHWILAKEYPAVYSSITVIEE